MARSKPAPEQTTVGPEEDMTGAIDLAAETLTGDVRDWLLSRLRNSQDQRAWSDRSEYDQRTTIAEADSAARHLVREAVHIIAAAGRRTILATVESVVFKDGIKATLTASKHDENRHELADAAGSSVLLVVADVAEFSGERAPVAIKPDQATMIGEDGMAVHSEAA